MLQLPKNGSLGDFVVLEKIISLDVGVAASLIKIAKSPFIGIAADVRTVKDALQILGLKTVATAIAGLALRKAFAHLPNLERFWDASACIAQISAWLATQVHYSERHVRPEEFYTFGLFRDAGIPVLLANYADYMEILRHANADAEQPFTAVEDLELGVNHALIGGKLAKEWGLPLEYQCAIEFHHNRDVLQVLQDTNVPDVSRYFIATAQLAEYFHQRATQKSQTLEWDKLGIVCLDILGLSEERMMEFYDCMISDGVPLHPEI